MFKIPKTAKRAFKGIIFDVYHWRQKMFDGSIETFECLDRPDTVQVIVVSGKRLLIAKQRQPHKKNYFYSFFGGRVMKGEAALDAAKRELLEEAGLVSQNWKLYKTFSPQGKIRWAIYYFIARDCQKEKKQNLDSGEKIKVKSINFNQLIELIVEDNMGGRDLALEILKLKLKRGGLESLRKMLFK
jgi:8-oxo-dGTP pyrophosphatase MutT (NUDIX family)